ncbi:MAG: hypothetical protein J6Y37_04190, partial [Paludibacteraceae bacterium]|nr:hypothetical protein [Paludibacteraceae bacterium]
MAKHEYKSRTRKLSANTRKLNKHTSLTYRDDGGELAFNTPDAPILDPESFRDVAHGLVNDIIAMSPKQFCDFKHKNTELFMKRLNAMKLSDLALWSVALGANAMKGGDSTVLSTSRRIPPNAIGVDYMERFGKSISSNENDGYNSTRSYVEKMRNRGNYTGHNQIYRETTNLFPDDLDVWDSDNTRYKWKLKDRESILSKTKSLFTAGKINTIISRFGTKADATSGQVNSPGNMVSPEGGMSHGRNLLTSQAERRGEVYSFNGYNNPYCRVWTHHYQYDSLSKLIRPFVTNRIYGLDVPTGPILQTLASHHNWRNFKGDKSDKYYWKDGKAGWELSSLADNGFVRIAPKFGGGGKNNIHTKQCMFSIENLAWRGYDPYSFEQALSWEQRGPLGGRIMWFPPYGITFNETTSTKWNSNTFIGRGEDVYTYVNTERSGTLSFLMVVDHPSIIDYMDLEGKMHDAVDGDYMRDTDILRYFAGCGTNDLYNSLEPKPLADDKWTGTPEKEVKVNPKPKEVTPVQPTDPPMEPEKVIEFYVFYPNNYSGAFDYPSAKNPPNNTASSVHAIAYLLGGKYTQKTNGGLDDVNISFENVNNNGGTGYEMGNGNISEKTVQDRTGNYIYGSSKTFNTYSKTTPFQHDPQRKWYYRIDGNYTDIHGSDIRVKNTYDQTLLDRNGVVRGSDVNTNYRDETDYGLNLSADEVKNTGLVSDDTELYSLAEVATAVADINGIQDTSAYLKRCLNITDEDDRLKTLKELLDPKSKKYELTSIVCTGYSNSHAYNAKMSLNDKRNDFLALERGKTVKNWLLDERIVKDEGLFKIEHEPKVGVSVDDKYYVSGITAKMYRSTRVRMSFRTVKTEDVTQSAPSVEPSTTTYQRFNGFVELDGDELISVRAKYGISDGRKCYKKVEPDDADKGTIWVDTGIETTSDIPRVEAHSDSNNATFSFLGVDYIYDTTSKLVRVDYVREVAQPTVYATGTREGRTYLDSDYNKYRYDQEYMFFK